MTPCLFPSLSILILPVLLGATTLHAAPRKSAVQEKRSAVIHTSEVPAEAFLGKSRSFTLEQAFDRALATDQSIRIAYYGVRKGNLQPWSALTRMGPSLTGNSSYQSSTRRSMSDPATDYTRSDTVGRSAGMTFSQPLFDPTVVPAYHNAKLAAASAKLRYRYTIRETLFGVARAYYDVLKQQSLVEVSQITVDLAREQLDFAKSRYEAELSARLDVLRAQASLEEARNQLIQTEGNLEIAKNTLSNILNLGGKTDFTLYEPANMPDAHTEFETALAKALEYREDYRMSLIALEQEQTRRQEIIAGYGPRISAQASSTWGSSSGPGSGRNEVHTGVINVQMPFLTGGQREIDLRIARHNIAESRLEVENTVKSVETDVKVAWVHANTGRRALEALRASVEASEQNYNDVKSQYEAGTAMSLDLQVALRELNNARTLLTNQLYDYQIALRDLQRAQALFEATRVDKKAIR